MVRRLVEVLFLVVQPLDPASRFGARVQVLVTVGAAGAVAFVPFGLANDWTWQKAGVVALGCFAVLSFWAAYRNKSERDAALAGTPLQSLIVDRLKVGEELERRVKRQPGDLHRNLVQEVIGWGGATVVQINELASDVGSDLHDKMGLTPQSMSRREAVDYMRRSLATLRRLARELRG